MEILMDCVGKIMRLNQLKEDELIASLEHEQILEAGIRLSQTCN